MKLNEMFFITGYQTYRDVLQFIQIQNVFTTSQSTQCKMVKQDDREETKREKGIVHLNHNYNEPRIFGQLMAYSFRLGTNSMNFPIEF